MTRTESDNKVELGKVLGLPCLSLVLEFKMVDFNYFILFFSYFLLFYFWRLRIRNNMTSLLYCYTSVT